MINFIDKIASYISPKWGAERAAYRDAIRYYQAGEINRLNHQWTPINVTDQENLDKTERSLICARARWLEANSDMANSAINGIIRNVLNTGIRPQARIDNENINKVIENLFNLWIEPKNCDITGQLGFYELQSMILRRKIVDGEILIKLIVDDKSKIPLKLQTIRTDLLDCNLLTAPNSTNVIRSGIELNEYLAPLAYWILQKTPDGYIELDPQRIPAADIIHLWTKKYPDQIRGISDLAISINRIKDADEYLNAETLSAKLAACFSVFITKNQPGIGLNRVQRDQEGKPLRRIRPGMITHLSQGEDVKTAAPARNVTTVDQFVNLHERLVGSGLGLSYEMMSRDFNQASYSAARQGNLEDRRTFQPIQQWLITHFCNPVYKAFLDAAVLSGALEIPDYWSNKEKYQQVEWICPGWQSIDPEKEINADVQSLQNGTLTLSQQCSEHGFDWRDQLDQMAKEKEYAESLGLKLSIHTPVTVQAAQSNHNEKGDLTQNDGKTEEEND